MAKISEGNGKEPVDLLIHSIGELVTAQTESGPARREQMRNILRIPDAAVAARNGSIVAVGTEADVLARVKPVDGASVIDALGKLVCPGLVDPHTHMVFAGNRAGEFAMRCQGKTYAEIASAGGGIVASMNATRSASYDELVSLGRARLNRALEFGTTTCEIKTGYGLNAESELRMLKAIYALAKIQKVEVIPTFMPAHAFPPDKSKDAFINEILNEMLPKAAEFGGQGSPKPFNDVFCDEGYFSLAETEKILSKGISLGLRPKVHADEFASLGATELACRLNAASCDHLLACTDKDIAVLAKSDTIAVLLPGTSFFLNMKEHAPARKMIDGGVAVALGSDFNPGSCHIFSLPFIWGLACLHLSMTPEEALTALTLNAAFAVGRGKSIGQIRSGYQADLLVTNVNKLEEIPYNMAGNPVRITIKRGVICHQKSEIL